MVFGLNRSSRYPVEEIVRDYEGGYSFPKLREKYGITMSYAWEIIRKKLGKTRNESEARIFQNKGWRSLPRVGRRGNKYSTRIVSIPFQLLKELGFKQDDVLVAKWKISDDHLELFVREKQQRGKESC